MFLSELNLFGRRIARDLRNDSKTKVDARSYSASSNHVSIFHNSGFFVCSSDGGNRSA